MTILNRIPRLERAVLGYTILSIGVCLGLFFSFHATQNVNAERHDRSVLVNKYFRKNCEQDRARDQISITTLENAISRINSSTDDPREKALASFHLQTSINKLKLLYPKCLTEIPPPTP